MFPSEAPTPVPCAVFHHRTRTRRTRGFAAIVAVFMLVVLGLLGATMVTIGSAQQRSSAFDALGARAIQAARAGMEVGAYEAVRNDSCVNTAIVLGGALSGFSVLIQCNLTSHTEVAPPAIRMFHIVATACNRTVCPAAADATYVERQLRGVVTSAAP
ncbi:MAG: agglutinin biogenesis protein MshP [Burkholderiales bacterium]